MCRNDYRFSLPSASLDSDMENLRSNPGGLGDGWLTFKISLRADLSLRLANMFCTGPAYVLVSS